MAGVVDLVTGRNRNQQPVQNPVPEKPEPPAPLPSPNDAAIDAARRRRRRALSARQGRASTIQTDRSEFSNERLGQ